MSSDYHPADTHSFLTKADLKDSLNTFSNLLSTAKIYRLALITLSNATAAFAKSLEDAARLKGTQAIQLEQEQQLESTTDSIGSSPHTPHSSHHDPTHSHCSNPAEKLLAASGLHFLTANLEQVLSDTFKKSFELPLLNLYESYRTQLAHQQNRYESLLSLKTKAIRETELRNMNQGGSRHSRNTPRDLDSFRRGLKELQDQVEQVESLKHSYYLQVAKGERQVWNKVAENISLVVKSEVEVYDRIASKPISDPTLEAMVASIPDPFDAYNPVETIDGSMSGTGGGAGEIYSILNPLSSLLLGSPQKARRSVDLNHSLASLQRHLQTPSPNGSLIHPHLNSATHWAESVADRTGQQPEPLLTQLDQPLPGPSSSSSPSSVNETNDPRRNVCSLLSTDSAITATPANPALPDEPRISPSSSSETADTTVVLDHPPQPADNSSIPHPSLDVPPPHIHRLSTTNSIQPHIDEVDSLLGEPPPSGLDLSDSDT